MSAALAIRERLVSELPVLLQDNRESAKVIALKIGTTPRCVQGLRQGEHVARSDVLIALARKYPPVKKLLLDLMDAETGDSGDSPSEVLSKIQSLVRNI